MGYFVRILSFSQINCQQSLFIDSKQGDKETKHSFKLNPLVTVENVDKLVQVRHGQVSIERKFGQRAPVSSEEPV